MGQRLVGRVAPKTPRISAYSPDMFDWLPLPLALPDRLFLPGMLRGHNGSLLAFPAGDTPCWTEDAVIAVLGPGDIANAGIARGGSVRGAAETLGLSLPDGPGELGIGSRARRHAGAR